MKWDDFDVERIKDDFYVVRQSQSANIGVCVKDNSALLIDSGYSPKKSAALKETLEEKLGCKIELLFNTHYHADHTFGNQSFECPILSSEECKNTMQENLSTHWSSEEIKKAMEEDSELKSEWGNLKITFPAKTFRDKLSHNFEGIEVIFQNLGGHTRGSSIACFPEHELMFSGDIVFGDCYPTQLSIDEHPLKLVEALQKITEMDVEIIVPGHGATCDKSMAKRLIEYWECLISECGKFLGEGLNDEKTKKKLFNCCHLKQVPFDGRKHERNVDSVLGFVKDEVDKKRV